MSIANRIQILRSNNASNTPGANGLTPLLAGELAINFAQNGGAGKLYFGNNSGTTTDITTVLSEIESSQLKGNIADTKLSTISTANKVAISALDIDGATAVAGGNVAAADLIIIDDGAGGTNRKATLGNLTTKLGGAGLGVNGATLSVDVDDTTLEISSNEVQIKDAGVGTNQIANDAVDSQHLAAGGIDEEHIANRAVTSNKIGLGAVVAGLLESSTSATTGAVTSDKIRPGAVDSAALANGNVTTAKIANDAITQDKIFPNSVGTNELAANSVTGDQLSDDVTIARDLTVTRNLVVQGDTTTLNVKTLEVEDTFIELNKGADASPNQEDTIDVGLYVKYDVTSGGSDLFKHTGLFRDSSKDKWIFFKNLATEPSDTPGAISDAGTSRLNTGTLQADLQGISSSLFNTIEFYEIDCGTF